LPSAFVTDHDAVIVGSGINSLACAALLARAGWEVCVLERSSHLGGAIQTAELTEPGFQHDVFSAWHPLWVGGAAHAELGDELAARGLEYLNTDYPTATLFPDRLWTATLGGFAIGFVSVLVNAALPTDKTVFLPSVVYALVIVVLLLRPAGLFAWGRRAAMERV
jgi:phytoene dehydrogenase-like protein